MVYVDGRRWGWGEVMGLASPTRDVPMASANSDPRVDWELGPWSDAMDGVDLVNIVTRGPIATVGDVGSHAADGGTVVVRVVGSR